MGVNEMNRSNGSSSSGEYNGKHRYTYERMIPPNDYATSASSNGLVESNGVRSRYNSDPSQPLLLSRIPKDQYSFIKIGFFILGLTTLLPWNFFITATDYWMYKFRNVPNNYYETGPVSDKRTELQTFFESYLSIASNVPMLLSMTLNSFYGQKVQQKYRMYGSLTIMFVMFLTTTIFVLIDTDHMQSAFFALTMITVVITNIFGAIFQASIFGLVASFPEHCMHSMVTGQACAGLFAVLIQIFSMINNTGPIMSALWYFLTSTIFLALAILLYWLMDTEYTRYYLSKGAPDIHSSASLAINPIEYKSDLKEAFQAVWPMAITTMLTFWTTIAVFPAVCVLIVPEYPNISQSTGRFYTPLTTFLIYNCGDLAGRTVSAFLPFPKQKRRTLLMMGLARIVIPPLILLCNVRPRSNLPVLFYSDFIFIFLNALLAFSAGYTFSSSMVTASKSSKGEHLEITGFIVSAFIGLGLSLGSLTSNILLRIV